MVENYWRLSWSLEEDGIRRFLTEDEAITWAGGAFNLTTDDLNQLKVFGIVNFRGTGEHVKLREVKKG